MSWWNRGKTTAPTALSISDPALVAWFNPGAYVDLAGVSVSETSALGVSGVFRAVSLISGTLASLNLNTFTSSKGTPERVASVFDDPDGPDGQTAYEWKETLFIHQTVHGRAGALKVRNEAGGLVRLPLVHPSSWRVELPTLDEYATGAVPAGGLWFRVSLNDGTQVKLDGTDFWYAPNMSPNGVTGCGLLQYARTAIGTAIAGDKAAANMFGRGALISGLATPDDEEDITEDIPEIRRQLNQSTLGHENAGTIALVNRRLKFTPWTMTAVDAQFLQSRQFQIEEISRFTGVPPHLLMQTEKQTSWGTGVEEQNRALGRTVLGPYATRVEQRGDRVLQRPRFIKFDFSSLERPSPEKETDMLIKEVDAGLLTLNEARAKRGLPPVEGGDVPRGLAPAAASADPAGGNDDPPAE